jgi:hypothetical protein
VIGGQGVERIKVLVVTKLLIEFVLTRKQELPSYVTPVQKGAQNTPKLLW